MKVNGKKLDGPRIVKVYLPIANGGAVEFKFRPLRSDEDFEKVMPRPKPKAKVRPGGETFFDVNDTAYKQAINQWASKKFDWEFLSCISVTEGLEWSTVDMSNPDTWGNWRKEMESHFGTNEINVIFQGFLDAQYISEDVMEKARAAFLTGLQAQADSSLSQTEGQ
jgi:hypothetical protein